MDDDRDPFTGDRDDDDTEAVARAFEQIAEAIRGQHEDIVVRFQALDRALAQHTGVLGDLIHTEYAGELARLGTAVEQSTQNQVSISEHIGVQQRVIVEAREAIQTLHGVSRDLWDHGGDLGRTCDRLEKLGNRLDEIVVRPVARAKQIQARLVFFVLGMFVGAFSFALGFWA